MRDGEARHPIEAVTQTKRSLSGKHRTAAVHVQVDLSDNKMNAPCAAPLGDALKNNGAMVELNLSENKFGAEVLPRPAARYVPYVNGCAASRPARISSDMKCRRA